jgi:hypothetical protein
MIASADQLARTAVKRRREAKEAVFHILAPAWEIVSGNGDAGAAGPHFCEILQAYGYLPYFAK